MSLSGKNLCFKHNNTIYRLPCFDSNPVSHSIVIQDDSGTKHYVPTDGSNVSSITVDDVKYSYDSSEPSIHVKKSGSVYNAFNKAEVQYDIPAGTYSPSAFETLIKQYISNNGYRFTSAFSIVEVNGQSLNLSTNTKIYYTVNSSSPLGKMRSVWFKEPYESVSSGAVPEYYYNGSNLGFSNGKCYVVYNASTSFGYWFSGGFKSYANYPITVTVGINFK